MKGSFPGFSKEGLYLRRIHDSLKRTLNVFSSFTILSIFQKFRVSGILLYLYPKENEGGGEGKRRGLLSSSFLLVLWILSKELHFSKLHYLFRPSSATLPSSLLLFFQQLNLLTSFLFSFWKKQRRCLFFALTRWESATRQEVEYSIALNKISRTIFLLNKEKVGGEEPEKSR